eukprot:1145469-Pelagomonas_calceolata.AAC.6
MMGGHCQSARPSQLHKTDENGQHGAGRQRHKKPHRQSVSWWKQPCSATLTKQGVGMRVIRNLKYR